MPAGNKRKSPPMDSNEESPSKRRHEDDPTMADAQDEEVNSLHANEDTVNPIADTGLNAEAAARKAREDRFKALKARSNQSRDANRKETAAEKHRLSTDPNLIKSLERRKNFAEHKIEKANAAADGEDFERKRAWDWTVDESERWDRRLEKKGKHRQDVAFQDYRQDARKVYKRQMRELKPDMEGYEKEKMAAVERAAQSGGLELIETEDGELIAVDKDGAFYSTADSTDFVQNKPDKAAIDRLVDDIQKAETVRLRKRKERRGDDDDDGDITYINRKNKEFNMKLKRFYDKYTTDIRDSFERGTAV